MSQTESNKRPSNSRERIGVVSFRELTGGLAWPLLGRSLGQSVRLVHLVIGICSAIAVFGGGWLFDQLWRLAVQGWFGQEDWVSPLAILRVFWPTGGRATLDDRLFAAQITLMESGWLTGLVAVLALLLLSVGLGAIARSTALTLGSGRTVSVREAMAFALSRVRLLTVAVLVPAFLIVVLLFLAMLFRWVFFSADFMQPIGATLFFVPLLIGFAAAVLLLVSLAGHSMFAPAVVVENTDGIDAVQRSWGYIVARPIRFAFYAGVALLVFAGAYWLFQLACRWGIDLGMVAVPQEVQQEMIRDSSYASDAIGFWVQVLWLLFIGWVISFYGCASTIVYLLMRLACDEQDVSVIWMPRESSAQAVTAASAEPVATLEFDD